MSDRKWRWGDRNDGRLLRSLSPMTKIMPYIMPQRCDACNSYFEAVRSDFDADTPRTSPNSSTSSVTSS